MTETTQQPKFSICAMDNLYRAAKKALAGDPSDLAFAVSTAEAEYREVQQTQELIEKARKQYANNDLEIDDDPLVSETDTGCWVNAWVWVEKEKP